MTLRNKLIRLAHQKPELREHLLPILKEAKGNISVEVWGERTDYTGKYGGSSSSGNLQPSSELVEYMVDVFWDTDDTDYFVDEARDTMIDKNWDFTEKQFAEALEIFNEQNSGQTGSEKVDIIDVKGRYRTIPEALKKIEKKINKAFNKLKASESMADLEWKYVRGDFKYKHTHEEEQLDWRGHTVGEYVAYEDEITIYIRDERGKELDQDTIKRILKALNSYRSPIWKQFK